MQPEILAAILGGVVGALFGGFGTYLVARRLAADERERRRKSLATAMLFELESAESIMAELGLDGEGLMAEGSLDVFRHLPEHIDLFDAAVVAELLNFRQRVLSLYTESHGGPPGRGTNFRRAIVKAWSRGFVEEVPAVRAALVSAGGILPAPSPAKAARLATLKTAEQGELSPPQH